MGHRLWDARTGAVVASVGRPRSNLTGDSLAEASRLRSFVADEEEFFSRRDRLFAGFLERERAVGFTPGHEGSVDACAFSPDGARLASASWDHTVRVWDAATLAPVNTLQGHRDNVEACAFSPDGRLIVSASRDGPSGCGMRRRERRRRFWPLARP